MKRRRCSEIGWIRKKITWQQLEQEVEKAVHSELPHPHWNFDHFQLPFALKMLLHTPSSPCLSFKIIKAQSKPGNLLSKFISLCSIIFLLSEFGILFSDNVLLLSAFKSLVHNQRIDRSISVLRGSSIPSSVTRNAASTEGNFSLLHPFVKSSCRRAKSPLLDVGRLLEFCQPFARP